MEKRRRARINSSLNELKVLILDAMKKDVSTQLQHNIVPLSSFTSVPVINAPVGCSRITVEQHNTLVTRQVVGLRCKLCKVGESNDGSREKIVAEMM